MQAIDADIAEWRSVPLRVLKLLPAATNLRAAHDKAASATGLLPLASVSWDPVTARVLVHTKYAVSGRLQQSYVNKLGKSAEFVTTPPDPNFVVVKLANNAWFPSVGAAWHGANRMLGGPSPLSNAIVSGLALSGLGYGAGTLIENIFPEEYLERGNIRKPLAALGALSGLGIGASNAEALSNMPELNKNFWQAWLVNTDKSPPVVKAANFQTNTNLGAPTIKVDAFNRAVWADASSGFSQNGIIEGGGFTPSPVAAATTGIVSGVAAQARSPIISPAHVITGLASAGVGLATASLAGRTIGALAGLTPAAQSKIQDIGLWGGMLNAVIPPVFGARGF